MGRQAWVVVACGLGAALAGSARGEGPAVAPCQGISFSATPASGHDATDKGFSARRVHDINLHVTLAPGAAPAGLVLKLFTPNGHLYQQLEVPIAAAESGETERALPGYRFPVKVARARRGEGAASVVDAPPLPVAGSDIVASGLYGRWRAEAWVKDAAAACSAEFNILQ